MNETGTVTALRGRVAKVEIPRSAACAGCKACVPLDGKDSMTSFVLNECGAAVGDRVELAPPESSRELVSSLLLYGLPLVLFVALLLLGSLFLSEFGSFALGLGGLALGYLAVWLISRKLKAERYMHRAVRVIGKDE